MSQKHPVAPLRPGVSDRPTDNNNTPYGTHSPTPTATPNPPPPSIITGGRVHWSAESAGPASSLFILESEREAQFGIGVIPPMTVAH